MADHAETTSPNESRRHFRKRVRKALNDPSLQRALRQAMIGLRERRNRGFQSYDFQSGRADLKKRRMANLDRLPELVEEFKQRLEEVEGQFHFARDAEEARRIIGEICTRAGAGIVTKSKSMATAEIELNPYPESRGMEVVAPDLVQRLVVLKHNSPPTQTAPPHTPPTNAEATALGSQPTPSDIPPPRRHH